MRVWIGWILAAGALLAALALAVLVIGGALTLLWIFAGWGPPPWMHDPNAGIP